MRRIIIALLVILLLLLVYVASCGPQQNKPEETAPPAVEQSAASVPDTNVAKASEALRAAGFSSLNVREVDGSLLIRGEVNSPADRVRAGRSLAELGMPVINHVRAAKQNVAKSLSLKLEKQGGAVTASGDVSAAMHQLLKQRFVLSPASKVNETAISTGNASAAVRLAAYALGNMQSGTVQLTGTQMTVDGQARGSDTALRTSLNRQLPAGYSLISSLKPAANKPAVAQLAKPIAPAKSAAPAIPVAKTVPAAERVVARDVVMAEPESRASSNKWNQAPSRPKALVQAVPQPRRVMANIAPAKTMPLEATADLSDYPLAETFPLEAGTVVEPAYWDENEVGDAVTIAELNYPQVDVANVSSSTGCSSSSVQLMPQGSIRFFHNSAQLTHKARQRMELALGVLRRCPQLKIAIEGHTDVTGSDGTNGDISRARAERIHQYLTDNGISPRRLRLSSYGDDRPAHSNSTKFGRAMNRRVDLVIRD